MTDTILPLAQKLIALKSADESLELALSYLEKYTIERFENNGVKSALVYNSKNRPEKFKIILNGHLDVIPGKEEQYIPKIDGDKLYGVGSMDMKANVACLVAAFDQVAGEVTYPLGLQLTTDEETGGFDGTKYQIEQGVMADFVIAGEPTNFDIVNKAKGILKVKISAPGTTAHGAYPWRGENAIWAMNDFLNVLKQKFPIPKEEQWVTTINLSTIETSNEVFNKIPDDCMIGLDVRFIPEDADTILPSIQQLLPKGFKLDVIANEQALLTDDQNEYLKTLQNIGRQVIKKDIIVRGAQGSSDARHYASVNCPGIEFGPIGAGIGSDSEWVDIPSLEGYCEILKKFLLSI